ncbi:unnamed protein product, partial [Mesorhabditis spiculigera]
MFYAFFLPIAGLTLFSIPIHVYTILIILKKSRLAFSVRVLMVALAVLRLASAISRSFFAMCTHRTNCWHQMAGYAYATLTNIVVTTFYMVVNRAMVFLELGLSINRLRSAWLFGS